MVAMVAITGHWAWILKWHQTLLSGTLCYSWHSYRKEKKKKARPVEWPWMCSKKWSILKSLSQEGRSLIFSVIEKTTRIALLLMALSCNSLWGFWIQLGRFFFFNVIIYFGEFASHFLEDKQSNHLSLQGKQPIRQHCSLLQHELSQR